MKLVRKKIMMHLPLTSHLTWAFKNVVNQSQSEKTSVSESLPGKTKTHKIYNETRNCKGKTEKQ